MSSVSSSGIRAALQASERSYAEKKGPGTTGVFTPNHVTARALRITHPGFSLSTNPDKPSARHAKRVNTTIWGDYRGTKAVEYRLSQLNVSDGKSRHRDPLLRGHLKSLIEAVAV